MILKHYIAQRRKQIEERIAAETLAGNEVKLAAEKAALAELDGLALAITKDRFYNISSDGENVGLESHEMSAGEALVTLVQSISIETYKRLNEAKK
jgi:hypothetical protein